MALTVFYVPRARQVSTTGAPMNGCKFKFYEAGSSTPLNVYADVDGITSLGATVTADAFGLFAEMFMLPQAYKVEFCNSADTVVWTADDFFPPQPAEASNEEFTAIAGVALAAGELAYISDGSGALNAGQAYKGDADLEYASSTPEMGLVVTAVSLGETVTLRTGGLLSGLSGLTPGALYYASGTAGAITVTPGTYRRLVGQAKSTTELIVSTNPPVLGEVLPVVDARIKDINDGRLTLTTAVPVTVSNVTAAATLYFTPYIGNQIALYTGSKWIVVTFAEMSVAAPATPTQMYDVFLDYNDGTPQLVLLAWTNDTTRATALTKQDGIYVKTGDTQQRFLGSVRTVTASQFNDAETLRHLSNYYHRVPRSLLKVEATASWNYSTATIRQANAAAANQVDVVICVQELLLDLLLQVAAKNDAGVSFAAGIGEDSTTTFASAGHASGSAIDGFLTRLCKYPAVGRHVYSWNEWSAASGTTTWYGTSGDSTPAGVTNGLRGWIPG